MDGQRLPSTLPPPPAVCSLRGISPQTSPAARRHTKPRRQKRRLWIPKPQFWGIDSSKKVKILIPQSHEVTKKKDNSEIPSHGIAGSPKSIKRIVHTSSVRRAAKTTLGYLYYSPDLDEQIGALPVSALCPSRLRPKGSKDRFGSISLNIMAKYHGSSPTPPVPHRRSHPCNQS
jgi:hypothetical protein